MRCIITPARSSMNNCAPLTCCITTTALHPTYLSAQCSNAGSNTWPPTTTPHSSSSRSCLSDFSKTTAYVARSSQRAASCTFRTTQYLVPGQPLISSAHLQRRSAQQSSHSFPPRRHHCRMRRGQLLIEHPSPVCAHEAHRIDPTPRNVRSPPREHIAAAVKESEYSAQYRRRQHRRHIFEIAL